MLGEFACSNCVYSPNFILVTRPNASTSGSDALALL